MTGLFKVTFFDPKAEPFSLGSKMCIFKVIAEDAEQAIKKTRDRGEPYKVESVELIGWSSGE